MEGYSWSNPNHAVNLGERMRHRALHVIARKQGDYEGFWKIAEASFQIPEWQWDEPVRHQV